jgi:hypothetical protein
MARTNMNLNNIGDSLSTRIFADGVWRNINFSVYDSIIHSVWFPVKDSVETPTIDIVRNKYEY